eukprot:scaffold1041_cov121-Cylindrotheca_fusiformis.AAC.9
MVQIIDGAPPHDLAPHRVEDDDEVSQSLRLPARAGRETDAERNNGETRKSNDRNQDEKGDEEGDGFYSSEDGNTFPTNTPGAVNIPGRSNNKNSVRAPVDHDNAVNVNNESSNTVVPVEDTQDREIDGEEAYQQLALDGAKALQEAEELRQRVVEYQKKDKDVEIAVLFPDDGSSTVGKKSQTVSLVIALVVIIAAGLLVGFLVQGKNDHASTAAPTSPPSSLSGSLPPLMESTQLPLMLCQGDCDRDVDCQDGLRCFQRTEGMDVPGCSGGQQDLSATDYCIAITEMDPPLEESSEFPLALCQGDCDSNADCKAGLICFQHNEGEEVPGCSGGADEASNAYCISQGQFFERFGERLVGSLDDNFGSSVSVSSDGRTMAVGAIDIGSTGYVNIYESLGESSWNLVATIVGDNIGDQFGHNVQLSSDGSTVAIGYVFELWPDRSYENYSARVRVLKASSTDNKKVWNVIGDDIAGNDLRTLKTDFSIALSGDGTILALVQPAPIYDDSNGSSLRVYRSNGVQWARIESPGQELRMDPIVSLSKRTDTAVRIAVSDFNAVQVYELYDNTWQQIGQNLVNHDRGAVSLSGSGTVLAFTDSSSDDPCYEFSPFYDYRDDTYCAPDNVTHIVRIYSSNSDTDPAANWTELGTPIMVVEAATKGMTPEISLSNDGRNIAVGEPLYEDVGRVRVLKYYNVSNEWTIVDENMRGHSLNELFGAKISLVGSGDSHTLAVGAPHPSSASGARGSVTSYRNRLGERSPGVVVEPTGSPTSFPMMFDILETWTGLDYRFDKGIIGDSVSLSSDGHVLAYGAMNQDSVGAVGVYKLDGTSWNSIAKIPGDEDGGRFGHSVSLSGDGMMLAVGIPWSKNVTGLDVDTGIPDVGRVRVFAYDAGTDEWPQIGLDIVPNEASNDDDSILPQPQFGHSVALSEDGSILAVGAVYGYNSVGNVDVFRLENGRWIQMGNPIVGFSWNGSVGWVVSLSSNGTRLAVGADKDDSIFDRAGAGRIYEFANGEWQLLGQKLLGEYENDFFGSSMSLSADGNAVAIGSVRGADPGHVSIFEYDSDDRIWNLVGKPIVGSSKGDRFGSAVSLSRDGKTVAAGASTGGYVRLFEYDAQYTYWREASAVVKGSANSVGFGSSVALSNDSGQMTLVVGAPLAQKPDLYQGQDRDQAFNIAGNVFVFSAPTSP